MNTTTQVAHGMAGVPTSHLGMDMNLKYSLTDGDASARIDLTVRHCDLERNVVSGGHRFRNPQVDLVETRKTRSHAGEHYLGGDAPEGGLRLKDGYVERINVGGRPPAPSQPRTPPAFPWGWPFP